MNILYVETVRPKGTGGEYITLRNKESLKRCAKVKLVSEYKLRPYKNSILTYFFYSLFSLHGGMRLKDNKRLKKIILEQGIDTVFFDNSLIGKLSGWIFKNTNVVYFFHNVEYLYKKQELVHLGLLNRILYRIRSFQIYLNEKRICRKASAIITINKRDSDCLNRLYKRTADFIWPTTFEDRFEQKEGTPSEDKYMLFVGSYFFGNVEGLSWFIKYCLPKCKLKLKVAGTGMEELSSHFNQSNVEFMGYVPDLSRLYIDASFVVLPILSGSGMKTKTCEAFMYGKTVIGTAEAFEGYTDTDPSFAIFCNTADEFINEINRLSETQESKTNNNARKYFLANYETSAFESKLNTFFKGNVMKNAVFCLLARDCAEKLKENIPVIEYYRSFFEESYVIVIENDSKDDTGMVLEDWERKSEGVSVRHIDSSGFNQMARIERMSICRNAYLEEIKKTDFKPEYLILIDADVELQRINLNSIINDAPSDWTGLFANGQYYCSCFGKKIPAAYYDLFAFVPYGSNEFELTNTQMLDNGNRVDRLLKKNEYIRCSSAFGGMGIYRYHAVEEACYEAARNTKSKMHSHLCEHLGFNRTCSMSGSLYICRSMKVLYERLSFKGCVSVLIRKVFGAEVQSGGRK